MNATQRARFADQASQLNREIDAINLAAAIGHEAAKPKRAKKIPNTVASARAVKTTGTQRAAA